MFQSREYAKKKCHLFGRNFKSPRLFLTEPQQDKKLIFSTTGVAQICISVSQLLFVDFSQLLKKNTEIILFFGYIRLH